MFCTDIVTIALVQTFFSHADFSAISVITKGINNQESSQELNYKINQYLSTKSFLVVGMRLEPSKEDTIEGTKTVSPLNL